MSCRHVLDHFDDSVLAAILRPPNFVPLIRSPSRNRNPDTRRACSSPRYAATNRTPPSLPHRPRPTDTWTYNTRASSTWYRRGSKGRGRLVGRWSEGARRRRKSVRGRGRRSRKVDQSSPPLPARASIAATSKSAMGRAGGSDKRTLRPSGRRTDASATMARATRQNQRPRKR